MRVTDQVTTLHANHQPIAKATLCGAFGSGVRGVRVSEFASRAKDPKHRDHKRLCVACLAALRKAGRL